MVNNHSFQFSSVLYCAGLMSKLVTASLNDFANAMSSFLIFSWLMQFTKLSIYGSFINYISRENHAMNISNYIDSLVASGRYSFPTAKAEQNLGLSKTATSSALRRLRRKGFIVDPIRGFQLILPPEYRALGCMPAEYFIDDLMHFLDAPYYVSLLSAAQFHGASHQKPQQCQVITNKTRAEIKCGMAHIIFVARHNVQNFPTQSFNTPYGVVIVAAPETTAMDIVTYPHHCGGIDNVATILAELAEKIKSKQLLALTGIVNELTWAQRLGYLFELIGKNKLAQSLEKHLGANRPQPCALQVGVSTKGMPYNEKWSVFVNVDVEIEI